MKTFFKKILIATSVLTLSSISLFANYETNTTFAKVSYSEPIYTFVNKKVKECYEVPVQKRVYRNDNYRHNSSYDTNSIGVDTLIGATIGVVLGNQIGKGNGKTAAKVVGGILGAAVANNSREYKDDYRSYDRRAEPRYETVYETKCETRKGPKKKRVITGYKNYFSFNGEQYTKISDRPLRKVRIEQTISF